MNFWGWQSGNLLGFPGIGTRHGARKTKSQILGGHSHPSGGDKQEWSVIETAVDEQLSSGSKSSDRKLTDEHYLLFDIIRFLAWFWSMEPNRQFRENYSTTLSNNSSSPESITITENMSLFLKSCFVACLAITCKYRCHSSRSRHI